MLDVHLTSDLSQLVALVKNDSGQQSRIDMISVDTKALATQQGQVMFLSLPFDTSPSLPPSSSLLICCSIHSQHRYHALPAAAHAMPFLPFHSCITATAFD